MTHVEGKPTNSDSSRMWSEKRRSHFLYWLWIINPGTEEEWSFSHRVLLITTFLFIGISLRIEEVCQTLEHFSSLLMITEVVRHNNDHRLEVRRRCYHHDETYCTAFWSRSKWSYHLKHFCGTFNGIQEVSNPEPPFLSTEYGQRVCPQRDLDDKPEVNTCAFDGPK